MTKTYYVRRGTSPEATKFAKWLVDDLEPSYPTSDSSIDAQWRARRQRNTHEGRQLRAGHREHFGEMIRLKASQFVLQPARDILDVLAGQYGLSWVDIGRMLHVSVPALRKWRRDENGASGENHRRLANLAAFCVILDEAGAKAPGRWLNVPFDPDYTAKPRDIYSEELAPAMVDHAVSGTDFRELLSAVDPDWRTRWARNFEVETTDDGEPVLVTRKAHSALRDRG